LGAVNAIYRISLTKLLPMPTNRTVLAFNTDHAHPHITTPTHNHTYT